MFIKMKKNMRKSCEPCRFCCEQKNQEIEIVSNYKLKKKTKKLIKFLIKNKIEFYYDLEIDPVNLKGKLSISMQHDDTFFLK